MKNERLVGTLELAHKDGRRAIHEFNSAEGGFAVQKLIVKNGDPLGNHYHQRKSETFVVTRGQGRVELRKVTTSDGRPTAGLPEYFEVKPGSVIFIPPFTYHTFVFYTESEMIAFSSAPYNPADDDLHRL